MTHRDAADARPSRAKATAGFVPPAFEARFAHGASAYAAECWPLDPVDPGGDGVVKLWGAGDLLAGLYVHKHVRPGYGACVGSGRFNRVTAWTHTHHWPAPLVVTLHAAVVRAWDAWEASLAGDGPAVVAALGAARERCGALEARVRGL